MAWQLHEAKQRLSDVLLHGPSFDGLDLDDVRRPDLPRSIDLTNAGSVRPGRCVELDA